MSVVSANKNKLFTFLNVKLMSKELLWKFHISVPLLEIPVSTKGRRQNLRVANYHQSLQLLTNGHGYLPKEKY